MLTWLSVLGFYRPGFLSFSTLNPASNYEFIIVRVFFTKLEHHKGRDCDCVCFLSVSHHYVTVCLVQCLANCRSFINNYWMKGKTHVDGSNVTQVGMMMSTWALWILMILAQESKHWLLRKNQIGFDKASVLLIKRQNSASFLKANL